MAKLIWDEKKKKAVPVGKQDSEQSDEIKLEDMTDEELQKYANDTGKDISKAKDRATAIKMLQK